MKTIKAQLKANNTETNNAFQFGLTLCQMFNTIRPNTAIIAGGFLRDLETGRQPKDVDVFIECDSDYGVSMVETYAELAGCVVKRHEGSSKSFKQEDPNNENVKEVLTLESTDKLSVDVIFLKTPVRDRVKIFPCNASMLYFDPELGELGEVVRTPKFKEFLKNSVLKFYDTAKILYIRRLSGYYPNCSYELHQTKKS